MKKPLFKLSLIFLIFFFLAVPITHAENISDSIISPLKIVGSTYSSLISHTLNVYKDGTTSLWTSFLGLFKDKPTIINVPTNITKTPNTGVKTSNSLIYSGLTEERVREIVNDLNNQLKQEMFSLVESQNGNGTTTIIYVNQNNQPSPVAVVYPIYSTPSVDFTNSINSVNDRVIAIAANPILGGNAPADFNVTGNVIATAFYGDGSHLTGISATSSFSTSTTRSVFSAAAPLLYSTSTGIFSITQASTTADGFLSSTDFTTFNNKQATITAGTGLSFTGNTLNSVWTQTGNNIFNNNTANVGIGTSTPIAKLDIWGNLNVATGTTPTLFVNTATGNVGIGTASPSGMLTLFGSNSSTDLVTGGGVFASIVNSDQTNNNFDSLSYRMVNSSGAEVTGTRISGVFTSHTAASESAELAFLTRNSGTLAEVMRLSSSGRLGLGTSTPSKILSIAGAAPAIDIFNTNASGRDWQLRAGGVTAGVFDIFDNTAAISRFTIDSSGNVGIGTSTPGTPLDVNGQVRAGFFAATSTTATTTLAGSLAIGNSFVLANPANNAFAFGAANVGGSGSTIGASGPGALAFGTSEFFNATSSIISSGKGSLAGGYSVARVSNKSITASGDGSIAFGNINTNSGSNILASGIAAFAMGPSTVNGTITASGNGSIAWGQNISATGTLSMAFGSGYVNNVTNTFTVGYSATPQFTVNSTGVGLATTTPDQALTVSGTIRATNLLGGATTLSTDVAGNIIRTPSDLKLKEQISNIDDTTALDQVLALQGVSYYWKDKSRFGSSQEIGFIAQDVEQVVPQVVKDGGEYKSLNYGNLTAILAGAIKAQQKEILDLQNASFMHSNNISTQTIVSTISDDISAVLQSFGSEIVNGIAYLKNVFVENLTVGSKDKPTGITIYDKQGKPGCLTVDDVNTGQTKITPGTCEEQSTSTSQIILPPPVIIPPPDTPPATDTPPTDGTTTPPEDVVPPSDASTTPPIVEPPAVETSPTEIVSPDPSQTQSDLTPPPPPTDAPPPPSDTPTP